MSSFQHFGIKNFLLICESPSQKVGWQDTQLPMVMSLRLVDEYIALCRSSVKL